MGILQALFMGLPEFSDLYFISPSIITKNLLLSSLALPNLPGSHVGLTVILESKVWLSTYYLEEAEY